MRNLANLRAGFEVSRGGCFWFERSKRVVAFEDYDGRGHRRLEFHVWKQPCKDFTKLLHSQTDTTHVFFAAISHQEKVFRAYADPRVFRGDGSVVGKYRQKAEGYCERKNKTFHISGSKD